MSKSTVNCSVFSWMVMFSAFTMFIFIDIGIPVPYLVERPLKKTDMVVVSSFTGELAGTSVGITQKS